MTEIVVNKSWIPECLMNSSLYRNVYAKINKDLVNVPREYFFRHIDIECVNDMLWYYKCLQFWNADAMPFQFYDFIYNHVGLAYGMKFFGEIEKYEMRKVDYQNLDELKLLLALERGNVINTNPECLGMYCAKLGYLNMLDWVFYEEFPIGYETIAYAAFGGQIECMKYLHDKGFETDNELITLYATKGKGDNLDCLIYAHKKFGVRLHPEVCYQAARHGNYRCLVYGFLNGANWDQRVCTYAVAGNHLDCLTFAVESECPINYTYCIALALKNKSHSCAYYLRSCKKREERRASAVYAKRLLLKF